MSLFEDPEIYRTVLESMRNGIYRVDRREKIRFWNEQAGRTTGYLREDVHYAGRRHDDSHISAASINPPECSTKRHRKQRPAPMGQKSKQRIQKPPTPKRPP